MARGRRTLFEAVEGVATLGGSGQARQFTDGGRGHGESSNDSRLDEAGWLLERGCL